MSHCKSNRVAGPVIDEPYKFNFPTFFSIVAPKFALEGDIWSVLCLRIMCVGNFMLVTNFLLKLAIHTICDFRVHNYVNQISYIDKLSLRLVFEDAMISMHPHLTFGFSLNKKGHFNQDL